MKTGDMIRVLRVPDSVTDSPEFATRSTLQQCVGRVFPIMGLNELGMLELHVGAVVGKRSYMESIWIEPECVELVTD